MGFLLYLRIFVLLMSAYLSIGLSPFIEHFDAVTYKLAPSRAKRSADEPVRLHLSGLGREFRVVLWPDRSSFWNTHDSSVGNEPFASRDEFSHLFKGHIEGDPQSTVFGSILDDVFDGSISTANGIYHVEKVSKYGAIPNDTFHSIIYSEDAVDENRLKRRKKRSQSHPGCAFDGDVRNRMEKLQHSAVDPFVEESGKLLMDGIPLSKSKEMPVQSSHSAHETPYDKYLPNTKQRNRRQTVLNGEIDPCMKRLNDNLYPGRVCSLFIQADQKLYEHVFNNEGLRDHTRTKEELFALINNHIQAVNAIYGDTKFGDVTGIQFVVQRTKIFSPDQCPNPDDTKQTGNPFCDENVDVSNFLNLNSVQNHSDFCLTYALTYRDFDSGTLGLAWVASPNPSTHGGICEVYKMYSEGGSRIQRSLNTGIVTLVNYNNRVPPKVSQLTLAHEIGHNFGSPHDDGPDCVPGSLLNDPSGNYIMFASATSGNKPNNAKFSECSKRNISAVLKAVLENYPVWACASNGNFFNGGKRNCMVIGDTGFCGNHLVEKGEQCDCGFDSSECAARQDGCCYPRSPDQNLACKLRPGTSCSPTQGKCCNVRCTFESSAQECRPQGDCTLHSFCTGFSPDCPPSNPKPDGIPCDKNTSVCHAGSCNGSICEIVAMEACQITTGTNEEQCQLACKRPSDGECVSSFLIPELRPYFQTETGYKGIRLQPGQPCNNYLGYCDVFHKCRSVDSNGPLARLKKLLFSSETFETIGKWVEDHWWAVVLIGIGVVLFMALFIKCCAVHTPSSNPNRPPAHSIYETLRHPSSLLHEGHRRHRHHHHRSHGGARPTSGGAVDPASNGMPNPAGGGIVVEPPPPYSAVVPPEPARYAGGPPRGHRKNKRRDGTPKDVEMKPTRRM